ncbi:polysaccharide deacetylase family protein [Treponema sp.]
MKTIHRQVYLPIVIGILLVVLPLSIQARVVFDGLNLNGDDSLLLRASTKGDGSPAQTALFLADATNLSLKQLTAFPENIEVLENGRMLQIRNPFGALRIKVSGGLPTSVRGFPSFAKGALPLGGRSEAMAASADGKYILYVEPVSAAFGRLVLIDVQSGTKQTIVEGVERPGRFFPASWSPDSQVFVYCRSGKLYSHSVSDLNYRSVDERFRLIGEGSMASLSWGLAGDFFYLNGSTVYRVRSSELFARSLYADFLEIGSLAGKIPFEFDPNFDTFWTAPDGRSVLLSKGGRNLFYFPLGLDDYGNEGTSSYPYLRLPRSCSDLSILWSPGGAITVLANLPREGEGLIQAFRLDTGLAGSALNFVELSSPSSYQASLSPDGTRALIWGEKGALLYDYINWKLVSVLSSTKTLSAVWLGNEEFIVADAEFIEKRSIDGRRNLICLSSAVEFAFDLEGKNIVARSGKNWFLSDGKGEWVQSDAGPEGPKMQEPAVAVSSKYRVYLEKQASGPYENMVMIRDIRGLGTRSLLVKPSSTASAGNTVSQGGSVALIFDLIDDAEGLPFVLDTLSDFGIKASFFLNGEFIRRHPQAAQELSDSSHELASMFYAPINLADSRYQIDADFIKRGLARNEDEYFGVTGKELALLWHAPFYAVSPSISAAAASIAYKTVQRTLDPLDWISIIDARRSPAAYRTASEIIDYVMKDIKDGSVLPIRLGINSNGRDDYLFNRLDVLLDALIRRGFEIVPVSFLLDGSRP